MSFQEADFTSNDDIDNIIVGDATVDMLGYVIKVNNNVTSLKSSNKYEKVIVSNGQGREVQVIAWNNHTHLLHQVKELGTIVLIGAAKANAIRNKTYNSGNVEFELLLKENSSIETFGVLKKNVHDLIQSEEVSIESAYNKINRRLLIDGLVRVEPRKHKNRDYECVVASITDGSDKLELKLCFDVANINVLTGMRVTVEGVMEKLSTGPPVLKITNDNDFKITDTDRIPFVDIIKGHKSR